MAKHANEFLEEKRHSKTPCVEGSRGFTQTDFNQQSLSPTVFQALCSPHTGEVVTDRGRTSVRVHGAPGAVLYTTLPLPKLILAMGDTQVVPTGQGGCGPQPHGSPCGVGESRCPGEQLQCHVDATGKT